MHELRINGEVVDTAHNKERAKAKANEIARDAILTLGEQVARIEAVDHNGEVHRSIMYDGWNVYTDRSKER
jgi:hypothetical protein